MVSSQGARRHAAHGRAISSVFSAVRACAFMVPSRKQNTNPRAIAIDAILLCLDRVQRA
jgi:hypothetical protein